MRHPTFPNCIQYHRNEKGEYLLRWHSRDAISPYYNCGPQPTQAEWVNAQLCAHAAVYHKIAFRYVHDFYEWAEYQNTQDATCSMRFYDWNMRREAWSRDTFGLNKDRGPDGPIKHLAKETTEFLLETDPEKRKQEAADIIFLAFDAVARMGMSFAEIVEQLERKLSINRERDWPKNQNPNEAVEHVRTNGESSG